MPGYVPGYSGSESVEIVDGKLIAIPQSDEQESDSTEDEEA